MWEDIKKTLGYIFGWIPTVLPEALPWFVGGCALAVIVSLFSSFLGFLVFLAAVFVAYFFRNPVRNAVFAEDEICCPADGRVLSIKTEEDPHTVVVRIFLSVFNVHVQRATMKGEVEDVIYTPGEFAFANSAAANKNERNLIKLSRNYKFAHIEQITGAIARRIKCWVKKGDHVNIGQGVGLIRFGSQVAVYMPAKDVRVLVKEGQRVEGGTTVLALWHKAP